MKRLLVLSACLLVVSCGGSSSRGDISCAQDYWDGVIGTCLPDGWDVVDAETLRQRGVPEETIVAFQASESVSGQFPTVAITRERLANTVDPVRYSEANMRSIEIIDGYTHIDTRDITIADTDVHLHIFTAQPIEGEPRRRFYQVSTVYEEDGFTATGVSPVSISQTLEDQILLMIGQVIFKEPVEEEG